MFFAKYDGYVGIGRTLEEAVSDLEELTNIVSITDTEFYEGREIKVELKVKEVPVKVKNQKGCI